MPVQKHQYETWLSEHCDAVSTIELLKAHRPYFEAIPSLRRSDESVIALPFPLVRLRSQILQRGVSGMEVGTGETLCLPCELGVMMCDPDWKIKTGIEIFVFVHRPEEDLSDLVGRWRKTQVLLSKDYEWVMPHRYRHIISEGADRLYPMFVVFEETLDRIQRGLIGMNLPFVVETHPLPVREDPVELASAEIPSTSE